MATEVSQDEDKAVVDSAIPQAKEENVIGNGNTKKKVTVEFMEVSQKEGATVAEGAISRNNEESNISDGNEKKEVVIACLGQCKWFDNAKGFGFITPEKENGITTQDVFVYQNVIQMSGYRSLKQGEKVRMWYKASDRGYDAVKVCSPTGGDCTGCEKKLRPFKKLNRCYNCGDLGHHAKECILPSMPKRCHHCKSVAHLVANCPTKGETQMNSKKAEDLAVMSENE